MPRSPRPGPTRRLDGTVGFGLILITIGVVLTLDNLDVVSASELLAGWWPVVVVAAGLWAALTGGPVVGVLLAAVGGLLLLSTQELVSAGVGRLVVPGVLVVLGGTLLQAGRRVRSAQVTLVDALGRAPAEGDGSGAGPAPAATAIFGDARLVVDDVVPAGGRVVVSATSVLGDVRVEVPAGWRLDDRITRVLGDVRLPADGRGARRDDAPVVELHGVVLLGDVKVTQRAGSGGAA
ncbi:MAG: LiaF transmembrane domain-containing protein [Nitriliruptoraceae bacterium]